MRKRASSLRLSWPTANVIKLPGGRSALTEHTFPAKASAFPILPLTIFLGSCAAGHIIENMPDANLAGDLTEPNYRQIVAENIATVFPNRVPLGTLEISGVWRTNHLKGPARITCLNLRECVTSLMKTFLSSTNNNAKYDNAKSGDLLYIFFLFVSALQVATHDREFLMPKTRSQELWEKAAEERQRCRDWLLPFMRNNQPKFLTKAELRDAAIRELRVSKNSFDFGWIEAIELTGRHDWYEPQRRRSRTKN